MALDTTPLTETSAFTANIYPPQANSGIASNDVAAGEQALANRTRYLYNGGPFPTGITVTQSTTDGNAITAEADGSGRGIQATGGDASGTGGWFLGGETNGIGIEATGDGTGSGAVITGGSTGVGLEVSAGGGNTNGIEAFATGTGFALSCEVGGVQFNGTQPTATADPGANAAHGTNQVKAFAHITTTGLGSTAGDIALVDGYNVASATFAVGNGVILTFARAFANANYSVQVTNGDGTAVHGVWDYSLSSTSVCRIKLFLGTTLQPPESTALRFAVTISGRQ